VIVANALVKVW